MQGPRSSFFKQIFFINQLFEKGKFIRGEKRIVVYLYVWCYGIEKLKILYISKNEIYKIYKNELIEFQPTRFLNFTLF